MKTIERQLLDVLGLGHLTDVVRLEIIADAHCWARITVTSRSSVNPGTFQTLSVCLRELPKR